MLRLLQEKAEERERRTKKLKGKKRWKKVQFSRIAKLALNKLNLNLTVRWDLDFFGLKGLEEYTKMTLWILNSILLSGKLSQNLNTIWRSVRYLKAGILVKSKN